jgi:hypothetical protein
MSDSGSGVDLGWRREEGIICVKNRHVDYHLQYKIASLNIMVPLHLFCFKVHTKQQLLPPFYSLRILIIVVIDFFAIFDYSSYSKY